ncbi:MAG: stage III sporulation protein AD [Clostridiales bacterium]|nr:stage III sporulation protein AD [Clostridiales bacterium]
MTIVTVAAAGIATILLAVQMKAVRGEYSVYLVMAAGCFIFFYGTGKLKIILDALKQLQEYIKIDSMYLTTLLKMIGITYIAEFASGICKDAGYGSLGSQIEIFGKLSILVTSMPVLLALFGTLERVLQA